MSLPPEIIAHFVEAKMLKYGDNHWFGYHFLTGHSLAYDIMSTAHELDLRSPGVAKAFAQRLGQTGGKNRHTPHYEQLMQQLCELVIARNLSRAFPAVDGFTLEWEPTEKGKKNPEFALSCEKFRLLVEVKCPSLLQHIKNANENQVQLGARIGDQSFFDDLSGGKATLPLDNKIKDFLISAQGKFSSFTKDELPTYCLLVICWEQQMFEAVSPLTNPMSGLFTAGSFFKDVEGKAIEFPDVTAVIVTQHLHFLKAFAGDVPVIGEFSSPLDYGFYGHGSPLPFPAYIANPKSQNVLPQEIVDAMQAVSPEDSLDPMTSPLDVVFWLKPRGR